MIAGLNLFVMSMPFVRPSARIITHAIVKMDSKETALSVLVGKLLSAGAMVLL